MDSEKQKAFLEELRQLTLKHKIGVGGCGCCGSPWLCDLEEDETADDWHYRLGAYDELEWTQEEETREDTPLVTLYDMSEVSGEIDCRGVTSADVMEALKTSISEALTKVTEGNVNIRFDCVVRVPCEQLPLLEELYNDGNGIVFLAGMNVEPKWIACSFIVFADKLDEWERFVNEQKWEMETLRWRIRKMIYEENKSN